MNKKEPGYDEAHKSATEKMQFINGNTEQIEGFASMMYQNAKAAEEYAKAASEKVIEEPDPTASATVVDGSQKEENVAGESKSKDESFKTEPKPSDSSRGRTHSRGSGGSYRSSRHGYSNLSGDFDYDYFRRAENPFEYSKDSFGASFEQSNLNDVLASSSMFFRYGEDLSDKTEEAKFDSIKSKLQEISFDAKAAGQLGVETRISKSIGEIEKVRTFQDAKQNYILDFDTGIKIDSYLKENTLDSILKNLKNELPKGSDYKSAIKDLRRNLSEINNQKSQVVDAVSDGRMFSMESEIRR